MLIEQQTWIEFQAAFVGVVGLMQVLMWLGLTTISTALITALICWFRPIKYKEAVTVVGGFYQDCHGVVVDNTFRLYYTIRRVERKDIVIFRLFLKTRRSELANRIRGTRL